MSQFVETPTKGFEAGAAIAIHILVKLASGVLQVAAADEEWIGVTEAAAFAAGDRIPVRLRSAQGTMKCTAAGAFAESAVLFGQADGKVDDVAEAIRVGIALEAAGAAGDIVEVLVCGIATPA